MASNRDMMYCEKTPGRRLRPAVKESCDRSLSPCHLRAMILTALLMLFSMGVGAKVTVETGKFTGGTIVEKSQTENAADGTVTVTLTVTPSKGYTITSKDITVVATIAPSASRGTARRNAPEIGSPLELKGDDPKDLSQPRDYTVTVDANLGVWVKEAKFRESGAKADRDVTTITDLARLNAMTATGKYIVTEDINASDYTADITNFSGSLTAQAKDDGTFPVISGLTKPLFNSINGGTVSNIMLKDVSISAGAHVGAIAKTTKGHAVIYNCGILPSTAGSTLTGTDNSSCVGSLVGRIIKQSGDDPDNTTRVINCFSYANVSTTTGQYATAAGIVGYVDQPDGSTTQDNIDTRPMVMNCMFYGEITAGNIKRPVYGGYVIPNNGDKGINNYNYFREEATFDNAYENINKYNLAWPAKEEYLTRFEYYRSILNSNRQLCTYWVTGKTGTEQTAADTALIAKWVLDPGIAPYPILKKWGRYPSVINFNKTQTWNPKTKQWVTRSGANQYEGKELKTITVNVSGGGNRSAELTLPVLDMDTLNHDYGYAKVQLPYYNDLFGDPTVQLPDPSADDYSTKWNQRYGGNYTAQVVTGWKITEVSGGTPGKFVGYKVGSTIVPDSVGAKAWEDGFNFADRNCTNKDKYSKSGRVFAQGGYYYVPEGVNSIDIEAYWGKAVYLHNTDHSIDRVAVTSTSTSNKQGTHGSAFASAGTLPTTINGQTVYTSLREAIKKLDAGSSLTVYDQAIVLVGNYQKRNENDNVSNTIDSKWHPFTIMSADLDLDNEPDYCMQWQFRNDFTRPAIQPIRFDFLPVPDLGLAIRHNKNPYTIGIFIPQGHFEITETAFMHLSQFEYDWNVTRIENESPLILNGGQIEQIVVRLGKKNRTKYILMGGNLWMNRFTPGYHASPTVDNNSNPPLRHCAVSVNGGEFPEFYLSGIYAPDKAVNADNPHCYINGGRFGLIAGAGYEQVNGNVTFKIDRAIIDEFYGGGINASKPVTGNIDVTIDNSIVWKYCGGPKVGSMSVVNNKRKTVTTHATGTVFYKYFGGGNGGTSFYREKGYDGNDCNLPASTATAWLNSSLDNRLKPFAKFNPLNTLTSGSTTPEAYDNGTEISSTTTKDNKGYHALFEFEVFNESNGLGNKPTIRLYTHWAQFGTTITGDVSNTLVDCKIKGSFYGGGNLGNVDGSVTSVLRNTEVDGSAFGGGYSAAIPSFKIHDKSSARFPYVDVAGVMHNGELTESATEYTWTNEQPSGVSKTKPYFQGTDGNWYCYTWESLENLGTVSKDVSLTIEGTTTVGGSVYGGGEESAVNGNTTVSVTGGTVGSAGSGGAEYGNVYGGGKGKDDDVLAGLVKGNTKVEISNGRIYHNVYGGGAYGSVGDFKYNASGMPTGLKANTTGGKTEVYITGGTFGWNGKENGIVFGSSRGNVGAPGSIEDRMAWVYDTHVAIGDTVKTETTTETPIIMGSVYGGGENGHNLRHSYVRINGGTIGIKSGVKVTDSAGKEYEGAAYPYRGNVYGGGCGTDKYYTNTENVPDPYDGNGDLYNPLAGIVQGNAFVNITAGDVARNVYGAGAMGSVGIANTDGSITNGLTTVAVSGGTVGVDGKGGDGNVFGAARGDLSATGDNLAQVRETSVTISSTADVKYSVYGGGEAGVVKANTTVSMSGGSVNHSVFGGGELGLTKGSVIVNIKGGTIAEDVYGGGSLANTNTTSSVDSDGDGEADLTVHPTTTVKLTGGTVEGNAYGGGLGQLGTNPIEAKVYGDVLVTLNETETAGEGGTTVYNDNCVVKGSIFGCNNLNGSPQGKVTVHIYKTQGWTDDKGTPDDTSDDVSHQGTSEANLHKSDAAHSYHLAAVYGGGNMAAYTPKDLTTGTTNVIIDGCGRTSIQQVYGGGNAASTPATCVTINGTYEIEEVFGGGNGKDDLPNGDPNPGANVGFYDYSAVEETYSTKDDRQGTDFTDKYVYGSGKASVNIFGGTIHRVFGGSNTKGNVRQTAVTMLDENSGCDFCVDEAYGGGKSAPMDAEAKLLMACIPGLSAAYGGAEAADIMGNVTLNITNGTFERVFGGNNLSGTISGAITVNIEEVGCKPIIIGELYGGGNQAAYSVFGYKKYGTSTVVRTSKDDEDAIFTPSTPYSDDQFFADPQVNVKSFTSIGTVYGGGYGADAVMVGNPTVNVSVVEGAWKDYAGDNSHYTESGYVYDATGYKGETLTIEDNNGSHSVSVPSHAVGKIGAINNVFGGGNAAEVKGNTNVNIGTLAKVSIKEYVEKTVTAGGSVEGLYTRTGAGTVASPYRYTAATGTAEEGTTYYEEKAVEKDVIGADIRGNVYGGGNNAAVTGDTNVNIGKKATE